MDGNLTRNQPGDLVVFFGSGLIGFGLIPVGLKFYHRGRNLEGSSEIWPRFHRIMVRSHRISKDMDQIWTRSRQIWSKIRNNSPKRIRSKFGFGVTGFEMKN